MIQRDLRGFERPEAVRLSESKFRVGVESLHNPRVVLLLSHEPVDNQLPMGSQAAGHLLERLQPTSHHIAAPSTR